MTDSGSSAAVPARRAHRPSRRASVLDAAVAAVGVGDGPTTLHDVAREAQMTLSSVYYHFSSLADILDELIEEAYRRATACFVPADGPGDLEAWLVDGVVACVDWMATDTFAAHLIVGFGDIPSGGIRRIATVHACADRFREVVAGEVSSRAGHLSPEQAWLLASAVVSLISALRSMTRAESGSNVRRIAESGVVVVRRIAAWADAGSSR